MLANFLTEGREQDAASTNSIIHGCQTSGHTLTAVRMLSGCRRIVSCWDAWGESVILLNLFVRSMRD